MADNRQINEKYAKIGQKLIDTEDALFDVRNSDVSIIYLSSDLAKMDKDRIVMGQCEKVADKYKWSIPADFTITLFEPNIAGKSDEAIRRIIFHELLHVGITTDKDEMEAAGVFEDTIRVSVGIENIEDLIEDFTRAVNNSE